MIMNEDRDNIRELLSAYIDGEVTQEQSRSIEQAVAEDPELALELHELTATKRLVAGLSRQRAPRGFVRRVMVRAERKHLLGDHQAGGAFAAARWITLAVAAVVLLAAGIGIVAVNMLGTGQRTSPIAKLDEGGAGPDGPGKTDLDGGLLHGKDGDGRGEEVGKAGAGYATTGRGTTGDRLVVTDGAFDYALGNAKNTSIYTHDVSNTLAVLHKTFDYNDVLPLQLEAPARDSKGADKPDGKPAEKKRGVSRGGLNFYYNKKQDTEQVQIVVLATDEVIERLNGDIDKLARVQKVSQAPASDLYMARSGGGFVARGGGVTLGKAAPAPVVTPAPKGAAPSGSKPPGKGVSQTGNAGAANAPATVLTDTSGRKKESIGKGDKPKPVAPKRLVTGLTTRPAETAQVAGGIRKGLGDGKDSSELEILSAQIAEEQKRGRSGGQLEGQYSKLNKAFRQQILNDDVRRNVQSQQDQGVNVQALVININRRSLGNPVGAATQNGILLRDSQALSRPRATTRSSPVSESTTRQATQPAHTSR